MNQHRAHGVIFVRTKDGLTELREIAYDSEGTLQKLIAEYPNLVAGDQIDATNPRRLALVKREMGVPDSEDAASRWAVDHLFLDQDGVPTLIEVKRSSDTRIRREVIGQMLDYAANAVTYWPAERIRTAFEATCSEQGLDPDDVLSELVRDDAALERFWSTVQTNLQAGRIRLVFAADEIPRELQRVIEFLNGQMNPAEVLALEVRQFVGQGIETLVPRVIGQTASAQQRKSADGGPTRQWDEASFLDELGSNATAAEVATTKHILEWSRNHDLRVEWGRGRITGSFFPMLDHAAANYYTFSVWTSGKVEIQFQRMQGKPGNRDEASPEHLRRRLNQIPGTHLPENSLRGKPALPLITLTAPDALEIFIDAFDTYVRAIRLQTRETRADRAIGEV